MHEIENRKNENESNGFIDLSDFLRVIYKGKNLILSLTVFISVCGIVFSFILPNEYESRALLVSVNSSENNMSSSLSRYGGLAALAGISIPSISSDSNSAKAIATMKSLSFFENNFMPQIFLPNLMAVKRWDHKTNLIYYDENIFNQNSNTWVRSVSYPKKQIPSAQESFEIFKRDHFELSEDIDTGFVTLTIRHQSPFLAKKWVEIMIKEINNFYRQKDKFESEKAVIYLNDQMSKTRLSEMIQVIAELLQQEIQKLTLIEANEAYVFDYIYPPSLMEEKSTPNRIAIFFLFTALGLFSSILIVLFSDYFSTNKKTSKKETNSEGS